MYTRTRVLQIIQVDTTLSEDEIFMESSKKKILWYANILYEEEFEDTKGVARIRKSKDRQHNGQKKQDKRTNNDLQNIHIKLKIEQWTTRTLLKTRSELRCSGTRHVTLVTNPVTNHEWGKGWKVFTSGICLWSFV